MATVSAPDDTAVSPRRRSRDQTLGEEIANAVTHGLGAGLALAGLVFLVVLAALHGTALHVAALALYGATLVTMFLASTLYHAVTGPRVKEALRIFDHVSILLLIAGTYTPFMLVKVGGAWGLGFTAFVWACALAGATLKIAYPRRLERLSIALYLLLGWSVVMTLNTLIDSVERGPLWLLLAGGVTYTAGVGIYVRKHFTYHKALWHLFVLIAASLHYLCVSWAIFG